MPITSQSTDTTQLLYQIFALSLSQAALHDETVMRQKMRSLVIIGSDRDVLEAVGVTVPRDARAVDVEHVLAVQYDHTERLRHMAQLERNGGKVDFLEKSFSQRCVRVCRDVLDDHCDDAGAPSLDLIVPIELHTSQWFSSSSESGDDSSLDSTTKSSSFKSRSWISRAANRVLGKFSARRS
ncbi:hypothetical protein D9758_007442 [Tetrapyrgos nigripes]|uniref:Uncharacterized protein n=1 Tax=Tetrapyrgos nigripes TaxID=182062 RepID=A0A8H5G3E8_9AGAR|nr:hypothetical protein D9758_007442 [Tetrapyrgos nigripes]